MDKPVSDTPMVNAELVNGTSYTVAKLARRLERDRAELMEALRLMDASFHGTDPDRIERDDPDTALALRTSRSLLARLNQE